MTTTTWLQRGRKTLLHYGTPLYRLVLLLKLLQLLLSRHTTLSFEKEFVLKLHQLTHSNALIKNSILSQM